MGRKRLIAAGCVLVVGAISAAAEAGVSGGIPSHSLGNSHGLNYRAVSYSSFSSPDIDLYANCKPSTAVVGGGVSLTGPSLKSNVAYGFPADDGSDLDTVPDDVWVGAGAQRGTPANLKITTYSICLRQGVGPVAYVSAPTGSVADGATFSVKATCPAGSSVAAGGSDVYRGKVSASVPFDGADPDRAPDDGWKVTGLNSEGSPFDLHVWAVCLDHPLRTVYASAGGKTPAKGSTVFSAACPAGSAATGGGYRIQGDPSTHFAHATRPRDSGVDKDTVPDDRWQVTAVDLAAKSAKTKVSVACLG
jgi:hypothetical protein